ncbi:MAG: adenine-specific methyltransferase EcoRI family protein [bacterium]|nr:adenine-specific methyltransferase EcoRI family protein [bacterium]
MANNTLSGARRAKNDEFYTQFSDIQKEVESYLEYDPNTFKGKVVYSNCDDPFESNFFRYFVLNFNRLGLKKLISTSYKPSPVANTQIGLFGDDVTLEPVKGRPKITANKFIINDVGDVDGDGSFTLEDIARQLRDNKNNEWTPLEGDGDFRSDECVELLKQSDIVVTNPPFSLFCEYITQLFEHKKQFLIIGNLNAITYREVFSVIQKNKVWLGNNARVNGGAMFYEIPEAVANLDQVREIKTDENGKKTYITRVQGVRWFTNLDHGRLHQPLPLMPESDVIKFVTKKPFDKYDNYDAIEVSLVKNIPSDYSGYMGVPISFLDKYSPEQFEIIGSFNNGEHGTELGAKRIEILTEGKKMMWNGPAVNKSPIYKRIIIKHKKK